MTEESSSTTTVPVKKVIFDIDRAIAGSDDFWGSGTWFFLGHACYDILNYKHEWNIEGKDIGRIRWVKRLWDDYGNGKSRLESGIIEGEDDIRRIGEAWNKEFEAEQEIKNEKIRVEREEAQRKASIEKKRLETEAAFNTFKTKFEGIFKEAKEEFKRAGKQEDWLNLLHRLRNDDNEIEQMDDDADIVVIS